MKADADESAEANGMGMDVSADNRYVVFDSKATNLVAGVSDANNAGDVFRLDRTTGAIQLVSRSRTSATKTSDGESRQARISGDGRFVLFQSSSRTSSRAPR